MLNYIVFNYFVKLGSLYLLNIVMCGEKVYEYNKFRELVDIWVIVVDN